MKWQNHIGLDIGSANIKVTQLGPVAGDRFKLLALGQAETPKFDNQAQWNLATVETVKKLTRDIHVTSRQAVISLPESQVYTRIIEIPFLQEPELTQAITWQAEQYIPVPLTNVVLKHHILTLPEPGSPGAKMTVMLLAAPNETLSRYMAVASGAGLEPVAVETEILATIRALSLSGDSFPQSLIVHIGAETTTFCIYREGTLSLVQSISTGAAAMARSVVTELGLDSVQADKYARSYGMDETKLDGKVANAVKLVVGFILAEARRVLAAYGGRSQGQAVKRMVLCGGGSIVPGLVPYLVNSLDLEVSLADPFYGISMSSVQKLAVGEAGPMFCVAVGLAAKPA